MYTQYFQRGMGMGQLMLLLMAIGFGATIAVNVVPVYLDNSTVTSALKSVQENYAGRDLNDITDADVRGKLNAYFQVNMISKEIKDAAAVVREKDEVRLVVDYEIRKHLMGNVDIVMVFENQVVLSE